MMTQDHKLPDLIWNEQTRLELRSCLEAEIRDYEIEVRVKGSTRVAWNFQQFAVRYESLKEEMQIGPIYVRHFLDAGDAFLRSLENPSHTVLFEKMFRRILVSVDINPNISILCAKCLTRLYAACQDIIGGFDDMMLIIKMLENCSNLELQHCLLDLVETLCHEQSNALQLLDKDFVQVIIKYASLAHLNPDTIGNLLAQSSAHTLLLTNGPVGVSPAPTLNPEYNPNNHASEGMNASSNDMEEAASEASRSRNRSLWVPTDSQCPRTWFVAPKGSIPPPPNKQRGPYRVSELVKFFDEDQLDDNILVAPCALEDVDEDRFEAVVDTGKWRPFTSYFQLRIQMLYPGK
jgi:hypothetical protein